MPESSARSTSAVARHSTPADPAIPHSIESAVRRCAPLCLAVSLSVPAIAQQPQDEIEVVASSPLRDSRASDMAGNAQAISGEELRRQAAADVSELVNRNLGSVFVNEAQSNPLQPDVQYRGFTGSPLVGLPKRLAVYQNDVRINKSFGDTVNSALLPSDAIDSLYLLSGSDPVFGLNALGGAFAVRTKSGFSHAGTRGRMLVGSFAAANSSD